MEDVELPPQLEQELELQRDYCQGVVDVVSRQQRPLVLVWPRARLAPLEQQVDVATPLKER